MLELGEVFQIEDPLEALGEFVRAFGHFWKTDRVLIRRLHGMDALDAEMAKADAARNDRRRRGLRKIVAEIQGNMVCKTDYLLKKQSKVCKA